MLKIQGLGIVFAIAATAITLGKEPVFSGPQAGERMANFEIRLALGKRAGEAIDPIQAAGDGPIMLVFIHQVNRPSIGMARMIAQYGHTFHEAGLRSTVIFLSDDPTDSQAFIQRARHALPKEAAVGISMDGIEGPGAYGLNREVTMTIVLGKEGRVASNFALIQPSQAVDGLRIGAAIHALLGRNDAPDLAAMMGDREPGRPAMNDGSIRQVLAPMLDRSASPEQVVEAAAKIEARAAKNRRFRRRVGQVARRIASSKQMNRDEAKLARGYLIKWSKEFSDDVSAPRAPD